MDRERFEELVAEALDALPQEFAKRLDNVTVLVEDEPSGDVLLQMGLDPRRDTLFGLYEGVPLSERTALATGRLPDRITIFYRPLTRACRSPEAIRRQILRTVIHEVGHFVGLDEDEVRAAGY
ncbi:MAG: metallopeptidase family protein [Deltaproteobacteria bacterium]|nr:metallopeptidase family protein [Deltaproteobacteria bacterium]MBI3389086.1 metallopeptidase family protein [Deltaproteobacteria bacterium]